MINTAGSVTHNVKFWFIFLVYKFTAVYFAQGISTVISALKNVSIGRQLNKKRKRVFVSIPFM